MWQIALLALASMAPAGQRSLTFAGEPFGAQRNLTCTWFTNFENSRFEQCQDATGQVLQAGDGASIECAQGVCRQLYAAALKAAGWRKPDPLWGTFEVKLVGRVSLNPHEKRYLGDATRTVLIERFISVHPSR
ncbi:hypothetical protein FHS94_003306 [Sphingomonas aerophila]|uniref:Uncharacterized protein n=1 Tax=Sphingomonas aerophila TaxID=1344948 RepID=A0A7W9BFT3_9SPHN|nr:hypothetical protein [Sphingomonas aerophila]